MPEGEDILPEDPHSNHGGSFGYPDFPDLQIDEGRAMPAKKVTLADVKISVIVEDEDTDPETNYRIPGIEINDDEVQAFVEAVDEMVEEHGRWDWCQVEVRAEFGPFKGSSHLGGCSYEGEEDFKKEGGYYEQMIEEAIRDLQQQISEAYELIHVND